MTPALTPSAFSAEVQSRHEHLESTRPLVPVAAVGAARQMRLERRPRHLRGRFLAVETGGYSGTKLTAMHPAIVPGAGTTPRTGGRRA